MPDRLLIINADDFGLSAGINRGIVRAHEQGILTSASLMVRQPSAADAARYARAHQRLGVGLHVDLGEWAYENGAWRQSYAMIDDMADAATVEREVEAQLAAFVELVGRPPTHVDSHQHVHQHEPARSVVGRLGERLRVVVRGLSPHVRHCGAFYGQDGRGSPYPDGISVANLVRLIRDLPPGVTEIGCHPGERADVASCYLEEREQEVLTLCDPAPRAALEAAGVRLISFEAVRL